MSPQDPIRLRAGALEAHVHPGCGARIGRFFIRSAGGKETDIFMPLPPQAFAADAWPKAGCFPMIPFVDQIPHNRLRWQGQSIDVSDMASPWFHGWGLRSPWQCDLTADDRCEMHLDMPATPAWPWHYRCTQTVCLDAQGLEVVLTLTNSSDTPMPGSVGIHPYLRWPDGSTASVDAKTVWIADQCVGGRFEEIDVRTAAAWFGADKTDALIPPNLFYEGWSGAATISYGDGTPSLMMSSDSALFLTAFAPNTGAKYVCLEPASHLPGNFGSGLQAGETLRVQARFTLSS